MAPNLLAHAGRQGNTDYRISAFAEDLRPYFVMDTSYDVIIGHSFGGAVAVSLLPFLPKMKETTVILLDPGLEFTEEQNKMNLNIFLKETANIKPVDMHMAKNPAWSRRDCVLRTLGFSMCDRTAVEVFRVISQLSEWGALLTGPRIAKQSLVFQEPAQKHPPSRADHRACVRPKVRRWYL